MSYDTEVLADSPRVYYKLNETSGTTADDLSGNNTDAIYTGGVTLGVGGPFADGVTAASFDGVNDYISVSLPTAMGGTGVPLAWEAWVYLTNAAASYPMIMATTSYNIDFRLHDTTRLVTFATASDTTTPLSVDNWYHVVGTYDGTNINIYINGVLVNGPTAWGGSATFSGFDIGRRFDGVGYWPGRMSRVAAYDSNLSAARVLAHYNAGLAELPPVEFTIGRSKVLTGAGTVTLNLTGSGTEWDGTTTFSLTGTPPTGWSISSQNVISATSATLTLNRGSGTGLITVSDGSIEATVTASTVGTTIGPGNMSDTAIWDTKERPGSGHTAVIGTGTGPVVCDANWIIDGLTINAALEFSAGVILTLQGDVLQGDTSTTFEAGAGLVFDTTAADRKWIMGTAINQTSCNLIFNGTSGSHCTISRVGTNECWIDGADEGLGGSGTFNTTGFQWQYVDVTDLGKVDGSFAIRRNSSGAHDITFLHCTFTRCATLDWSYGWSPIFDADFRIEDCKWIDSITGSTCIDARIANSTGAGTISFLRNVIDKECDIGLRNGNIDDNYFDDMPLMDGSLHASFDRNCVRYDKPETITPSGPVTDLYLLADQQLGNPHFYSNQSASTHDGVIFEYPWVANLDQGDGFYGGRAGDVYIRCLVLASESDGLSSCNLMNPTTDSVEATVIHNTIVGEFANLMRAENNVTEPAVLICKSNIIASPTTVTGTDREAMVWDDIGFTHTDLIDPSGISDNYIQNPILWEDPVTFNTYPGYRGHFSAPPGTDIIASGSGYESGPDFVDATRNFANWAVYKGVANSGDSLRDRIDAGRALLSADPTLAGTDLIPWVRAGYAPQNPVLENAGHDGVTIGAVEYAAGGTTITVDGQMSFESINSLNKDGQASYENTLALNIDGEIALESTGSVLITVDGVFAIENMANISVSSVLIAEFTNSVLVDGALPLESVLTISKDNVICMEWDGVSVALTVDVQPINKRFIVTR